jgi:hypothetical protein
MSLHSLIPFALRASDQQLVDVSEVSRGKRCACICPSCKTPLIARQGTIKEWHFAHAFKGVSDETQKECEYSFWVSVVLMAKQIMATANTINLPAFIMYTQNAQKIKVTDEKMVRVDYVEIERKYHSIAADALLKLGEYLIAIIFSSPHKNNHHVIPDQGGLETIGVLEISLFDAFHWLFKANHEGKYSEILKHHILSSNDHKKWRYHPRTAILEKKYHVVLSEKAPIQNYFDDESQYVEQKRYVCLICGNDWFGTVECVRCGTHLYSTVR